MVADQLRISQGWVRCGVCQSVFDASLNFVVESAVKAEPVPAHIEESAGDSSSMSISEAEAASETWVQETHQLNADAELIRDEEGQEFDHTGADRSTGLLDITDIPASHREGAELVPLGEMDSGADGDKGLDSVSMLAERPESEGGELGEKALVHVGPMPHVVNEELEPVVPPQHDPVDSEAIQTPADVQATATPIVVPPDNTGVTSAEPGFVREAKRKAFWRRPLVRLALVFGCLLAWTLLAGQYLWYHRDSISARQPQMAPVLQTMCHWLGCELGPRKAIEEVVIISSGFKQLPGEHTYQWSLSLKNRSASPVAMPTVEFTLNDAQDRPILRKVIDLRQLGAPVQLSAHGEWSVAVPMQIEPLSTPVAGYRSLVFYP